MHAVTMTNLMWNTIIVSAARDCTITVISYLDRSYQQYVENWRKVPFKEDEVRRQEITQ